MDGSSAGSVPFGQVVDQISDLIVLVDGEFRLRYVNRALERTLGWHAAEALGTPAFDFVHPDDVPALHQLIEQPAHAPTRIVQFRARTQDGDYRILRVQAHSRRTEGGALVDVWLIGQDITEQVALEQAHQRRSAHLVALMELFQRQVMDAPPLTLLQNLLDAAIESIPDAQRGTILLRRTDGFHFLAASGWPMAQLRDLRLPLQDPRTEALERGEKVVRLQYTPEIMRAHGFDEPKIEDFASFGTLDIAATICVPIFLEGELFGYINLDNMEDVNAFDELAYEALILFAGQAAVSLKYQRLLDSLDEARERAREQAARQEVLARIATLVNSTLELDSVLETSMPLLGEALHAQQVGVVFFDEAEKVGRVAAQWSVRPRPPAIGMTIPMVGNASIEWLQRHLAPLVINDAWQSPLLSEVQHIVRPHDIRSLLLLPILIKDQLVGSIGVDVLGEPRTFQPDEVDLAHALTQGIAVAIERARLYEQSQQRVAQVEALHALNLQLTTNLELSRLLTTIAQSVLQLVGGSDAHIFLYDEPGERFEFGAAVLSDGYIGSIFTSVRPDGLTATVARQREIMLIEDAATHPLFQDQTSQEWAMFAIAGIPLMAGGQVLGVLNVAFTEGPHRFVADEVRLIELFAGHAAIAIQNARLFERERLQREGLETLHEAALALLELRDEPSLRERTLDTALAILQAEAAAFWTWDTNEEQVVIRASRGLSEEYVASRALDRSYLNRRDGGYNFPLILNDVPTNQRYPQPAAAAEGIHHALSVPIRNQERWLGALVVYNRDPACRFTVDHLQRATTLAAQTALAIENIRHFAQAQQRAGQLVALNQVMLEVSRETDMAATLSFIVSHAAPLIRANGALVYLRNPNRPNRLQVATATFPLTLSELGVEDIPQLAHVLEGEGALIEEYERVLAPEQRRGHIGPVVAAPLRQADDILGIVAFSRPPSAIPFDQDDLWLVELFGKQIAVAVTRARMLDEMQRRLRGMNQLRAATLAISQQLDMQALYQAIVEEGCRLLDSDRGYFLLVEGDRIEGAPAYHSVASDPTPDAQVRALAEAARHSAELQVRLRHDGTEMESVALPLRFGAQWQGCLLFVARAGLLWEPHVESILRLFATQAAIILENARLYEASHEMKQFYENIVQWMDEGILIVDNTGVVTYGNRAADTMLGFHAGELVGSHVESLTHPDDLPLLREQRRRRAEGETGRYELRVQRPSGETVPIVINSKVLRDEGGPSGQSLSVFSDISERKRLEQQLLQADRLSAIGELVSGVAHELNNPLTSIIGYAQLLRMNLVEGEEAHDVERIASEAKRAARIVRNLLAFARQHKPEKQLVDVNELLHNTLDLRAYYLRLQGVGVEWDLDETLPTTSADPHQLQQVFMNLLTNAEQAMAELGRGGTLRLATESLRQGDERLIRIIVQDSGAGMSGQVMGHIFDPFYTTKEVGKGTGLGLSICFGIVQEHGGTIEAESQVGRGSRFIVTLPVQRVAVVERAAPSALRDEVPAAPSGTIVVVDDERAVSTLISQLLRLQGHQVTTAASAEEFLPLLEAGHPFDLLLCDLKMPGMGGAALFARLRKEHPELAERVIFMTGDMVAEETRHFLQHSGRPYLDKPFRIEELQELVDRHLNRLLRGRAHAAPAPPPQEST